MPKIPGVVWLAVLHNSEDERVSEVILRDSALISEALHGRWTVEEYIFTREIREIKTEEAGAIRQEDEGSRCPICGLKNPGPEHLARASRQLLKARAVAEGASP
jgi:hypothetical protein